MPVAPRLAELLTQLHVHYAFADAPGDAEDAMIDAYCAGVSAENDCCLGAPAEPAPPSGSASSDSGHGAM
jgi:hypothetical protein